MSTTIIDLPIDDAFDLVTDARRYPEWLVGAQEIDDLGPTWPDAGARFDHHIGFGPLTIPGSTTVRAAERPHRFVLAAGMGVLGEARVEFRLDRVDDHHTCITIAEAPSRGLARIGWFLSRPMIFGLLWGRNQISLDALGELASHPATAD